jgi:hypothetical protein
VALLYRCSDPIKCWLLCGGGWSALFILFHALGGGQSCVATRVPSGCGVITRCARELPLPLY